MKTQSTFVMLRDLAQKEADAATTHLGHIQKAYLHAEQQLNMLLGYHDDYRQRLNDSMTEGMANTSWQNYQQFILTLEKAIEQHQHQLLNWSSRLNQAIKAWQEKQQRLNAFSTLQQREQTKMLAHENRQEQKRMDEFAQRASMRKT
ncbi:flagella biosynthesis chaperone FliJ [Dickeya sp. CFBP 2040]|uniref:Flagellar FliJ protein n=1 Tax=Dickeya poaceiphila TaxID=568768 RepID=A0A5B8I4X4_9GAMM|nr:MULTISPECIES: flagellar export protein FliJ [Dickeya]NKI74831.1 flagella biosynthesis chaperone FliJ [Dickeya sp. CFBP 2040]QDX29664.1 flagella biosynthesis chaperone FliJ [Dickeya poaceiphila]